MNMNMNKSNLALSILFLAVFFGCGQELIFDEITKPVQPPTASVNPGDPLNEGERPTGTPGTFELLTQRLPYKFEHGASVQIGRHVYLFGGYTTDTVGGSANRTLDTIIDIEIQTDGNVGTISVSPYKLNTSRRGMKAVVIGEWVYIVGGYLLNGLAIDSMASGTSSVVLERARIVNGAISENFSNVATYQLDVPRANFEIAKIGNYVYILGGEDDTGTVLSSVARATITNGEISSSFTSYANSLTAPRYTHAGLQVGNYYYILGGANSGGAALNSIEVAPISPSGDIGAFVVDSKDIGTARNRVSFAGLADSLVVFGGWSGAFLDSVYSAPIANDVIQSNFTSLSGVTLDTAMENGVPLVTRSAIYYFGGYRNTPEVFDYIQRAPLQ